MSSWDDTFHEHRLWRAAEELKAKAVEMDPRDEDNARDSQQYVIEVASMVLARKDTTLPLHVTELMLDKAAGQVDAISSYLDGWQAGTYTDGQMDTTTAGLVTAMAEWPAATPQAVATANATTVEAMTQMADNTIETLTQRRVALETLVGELEQKAKKLEEGIDAQQVTLDSAIGTFETSSAASTKSEAEKWTAEREAQSANAEERLSNLADLEKQARDMVHATTGSTVATDYGKYARNKTIAAWLCDVAAALIGAVGVSAILYHLFTASEGSDGNVGLSLTRLAASLGTLGIAALVAHRGHDHHKEARAAKRTDLAIRRVGPFTANLPEDVRQRIVVDLTDRIFIRGELEEPPDTDSEKPSLWERIRRDRVADESED